MCLTWIKLQVMDKKEKEKDGKELKESKVNQLFNLHAFHFSFRKNIQ